MPVLAPPVDAPIVRPFQYRGSPFAVGLHRGVDFGAPAGTPVRAPCDGRVTYAGPSPRGRVVTLACGGRRITLLPLAAVDTAKGDVVARSGVVGRTTAEPLHLGVRRAADRFGYVDPQDLLGDAGPPIGPAPTPSRRGRRDRPGRLPAVPRQPVPRAVAGEEPAIAPWPAWLGAALTLAGATTGRARRRRRGRAAGLEHAGAAAEAGAR